jgi:SAM-dependent methyltransferase
MSNAGPESRELLTDFFEQQQSTNQYESLKRMTQQLDREAAVILNREARGSLLCIGGIWDFFERGAQIEKMTCLDLSSHMLKDYCPDYAEPVVGDLYTHEFPRASFDTVAFSLMLHHTPQGNWAGCEERIREAVRRAHRWLRPGGKVIILEYCPHPAWMLLQRPGLPITRTLLKAFGQPLVVMYPRHFYEEVLNTEFGNCQAYRMNPDGFDWWAWYPIFMSIRWLKMPFALYPKLHVFTATAA